MKEFVETLICRLEEEIAIEEGIAKGKSEGNPISHQYASNCLKEFRKHINQLAEEYKYCEIVPLEQIRELLNMDKTITNGLAEIEKILKNMEIRNGWIPCSERVPETNESVLCWAKSTARGGDVCFVGSCHNGFWFLQSSANTHSFPGQYKIAAWQPLPAPYQKGSDV